jgi:group I intron endonuclease
MFYIYLITNKVNGKIYVGQTESTIEERFKNHVWSREKQDYFHAAIRKYGKDAFVVQELGQYETLEETNNAESLWILLLRSYDNSIGYNTTFGGKNGGKPTEETRAKIGLASGQRTHDSATRDKMRTAHISRTDAEGTTGVRGIDRVKLSGRFRARTKLHGKEIGLGNYDTLEEATQAKEFWTKRMGEVPFEQFSSELKEAKKLITDKRIAERPHRGPVSDEEKEQISIRTKKRWAKNFNWTNSQFVSPFVEDDTLLDTQKETANAQLAS